MLQLNPNQTGIGNVTPELIGYSKLLLSAMICWPWAEVRKATNFWASAWFEEDLRTPAPETSTTYPTSLGAKWAMAECVFDAPSSACWRPIQRWEPL